jgi:3-dehydroquinate dehydratase/shikimate dehydrogenase
MVKICLCLTGKTIEENLTVMEQYRSYTDIAEFRLDFLVPEELPYIGHLPSKTDVPVIITMRKKCDGGHFARSDEERLTIIWSGIEQASAVSNPGASNRNFAFVDIEDELDEPKFEKKVREWGIRIIRSLHDFEKTENEVAAHLHALNGSDDEILKVALMSHSIRDVERMYQAAKKIKIREKIILCIGTRRN